MTFLTMLNRLLCIVIAVQITFGSEHQYHLEVTSEIRVVTATSDERKTRL